MNFWVLGLGKSRYGKAGKEFPHGIRDVLFQRAFSMNRKSVSSLAPSPFSGRLAPEIRNGSHCPLETRNRSVRRTFCFASSDGNGHLRECKYWFVSVAGRPLQTFAQLLRLNWISRIRPKGVRFRLLIRQFRRRTRDRGGKLARLTCTRVPEFYMFFNQTNSS